MPLMLRACLLAGLLALAACNPNIVVDQDPTVSLPGAATYAWDTPQGPHDTLPGENNPRVNNDIVNGMMTRALDEGLRLRGYQQTEKAKAAWLVHYHTGLEKRKEVIREPMLTRPPRTVCFQNRGCVTDYDWGWYGPPEYSTRTVTYNEGAIMVDIQDASTGKLVWRGILTEEVNVNQPIDPKQLQEAVNKLLAKLPGTTAPASR